MTTSNTSIAERVRRHRARRAKAGLRLARQRWVYDLGDPAVRVALARECQAIAACGDGEADIERWLDEVRDTDGWT